jgi:hypothetical protein
MKRLFVIALMATGLPLLGFTSSAPAVPSSFQLVFVGHDVVASYQPSPTGVAHVGTFTTNSTLCPSGSGEDIAETAAGVATRLFACDGSGATFTATINPHVGELGGAGSWLIFAGTGTLADLRGQGTFSSVLTAGSPSDIPGNLLALAFRSTWAGVVDVDATPPSLALTKAVAVKLKRPRGAYRVSVALDLSDSGGGPVAYTLTVVDPANLETVARKSGTDTAPSITWTFVTKRSRSPRALRLQVDVSDQVGNRAQLRQMIVLRT